MVQAATILRVDHGHSLLTPLFAWFSRSKSDHVPPLLRSGIGPCSHRVVTTASRPNVTGTPMSHLPHYLPLHHHLVSRDTSLLTVLHAHVTQSASGPLHDSLPSLCLKLAYAGIPVLDPSFTQLSAHGHLSERPALTPVLKQHPASFSRPWALLTFLQGANHPLKQNKSISASVSASMQMSICIYGSFHICISTFSVSVSICISIWYPSYMDK